MYLLACTFDIDLFFVRRAERFQKCKKKLPYIFVFHFAQQVLRLVHLTVSVLKCMYSIFFKP